MREIISVFLYISILILISYKPSTETYKTISVNIDSYQHVFNIRYSITPQDHSSTEKSLLWCLRKTPRHKINTNKKYRMEIAKYIDNAADRDNFPRLFVASIVHKESGFNTNKIGKLGEKGLMQVWGAAAKGCELETPEGQLKCGTKWLRFCTNSCAKRNNFMSYWYGLALYATGKPEYCNLFSDGYREVVGVVGERFMLWDELERKFGNGVGIK